MIRTTTIPAPVQRPLPERLKERAFDLQVRIADYCFGLRAALQGDVDPPSARVRRRAFEAAEQLVAMTERRPLDLVQTGVDLRLYTSGIAEDLEAVNCEPALIEALTAAG